MDVFTEGWEGQNGIMMPKYLKRCHREEAEAIFFLLFIWDSREWKLQGSSIVVEGSAGWQLWLAACWGFNEELFTSTSLVPSDFNTWHQPLGEAPPPPLSVPGWGGGGWCPLEGRNAACTAGMLFGAWLQFHPLQSELSATMEGTQLWEERDPGLSCGSILWFNFRISVAQLAQWKL